MIDWAHIRVLESYKESVREGNPHTEGIEDALDDYGFKAALQLMKQRRLGNWAILIYLDRCISQAKAEGG